MLAVIVRLMMQTYDSNYMYTLLIDQECRIMNDFMPDIVARCPQLIKAKSMDPDLPPLHVTMAGQHQEEFL